MQQTSGIINRLVSEISGLEEQIKMTGVKSGFYPPEALPNIKRVADSLESEQRSEELQKGLRAISTSIGSLRNDINGISSEVKNVLKNDIKNLQASLSEATSTLQTNQDQQFEYVAEQIRNLNAVLAV